MLLCLRLLCSLATVQKNSLSAEREQLDSAHGMAMAVELEALKVLEAEDALATREHDLWMEEARLAQDQLRQKLQHAQNNVANENDTAGTKTEQT